MFGNGSLGLIKNIPYGLSRSVPFTVCLLVFLQNTEVFIFKTAQPVKLKRYKCSSHNAYTLF